MFVSNAGDERLSRATQTSAQTQHIISVGDRQPGARPRQFRIDVPRSYKIHSELIESAEGYQRFQPLITFRHSSQPDERISIGMCESTRDVAPADWLEIDLDAQPGEILAKRSTGSPFGTQLEILYRSTADDKDHVSIIRTSKDGARLFRIEAAAPAANYNDVAHEMYSAVNSFRMTDPEPSVCAEPLVPFRSGILDFQYPESWRSTQSCPAMGEVCVDLATEHDGQIAGTIVLKHWLRSNDQDAARIVRAYSEACQQKGMHCCGAALVSVPAPPNCRAAHIYQPRVTFGGRALEMPTLVFESDHALVLLGLVGPTRDESPEWWAINKRAFEIVRDSLQFGEIDSPSHEDGRSPEHDDSAEGLQA